MYRRMSITVCLSSLDKRESGEVQREARKVCTGPY